MNILKKIPNKKSERNIILFDTGKNSLNSLNKIETDYSLETWLKTNMMVYKVYYGDVYNPPFFNNIISLRKNNLEDVQQIWNMTLINGYILLDSHFKSLFSKSIIKEDTINNKILIQKNIPLTYQFPKYRVLDFIIAGTMKGGTTAAITNLSKHPDISMVKNEIHYFDKKDEYQRGIEWYKNHFDYTKKMVGDKAPDVMYQSSCLELLQLVNPQVKIILFLRNPIDRAYSHWKMSRDIFRNTNSFEYSVHDEIQNRWNENRLYRVSFWYHFVQRGLYYKQIEEILKYFPRDNLLVIISEKIRKDPDEEHQKIFNFLGLPNFHNKFIEEFSSKNETTIDKKSAIYKELKKIYNPDVKKLEKFLGYKTGWW